MEIFETAAAHDDAPTHLDVDLPSLAALAILVFVPHQEGLPIPFVAAVTLTGFQNAWNIVRWGSIYAQSSGRRNLSRVPVAVIAIACIKLLTLLVPTWAVALLLSAMLGWTHVCACSNRDDLCLGEPVGTSFAATAQRNGALDLRTLGSLWQTLLSVAFFFVLWSFLNMGLVSAVGHITNGPAYPGRPC